MSSVEISTMIHIKQTLQVLFHWFLSVKWRCNREIWVTHDDNDKLMNCSLSSLNWRSFVWQLVNMYRSFFLPLIIMNKHSSSSNKYVKTLQSNDDVRAPLTSSIERERERDVGLNFSLTDVHHVVLLKENIHLNSQQSNTCQRMIEICATHPIRRVLPLIHFQKRKNNNERKATNKIKSNRLMNNNWISSSYSCSFSDDSFDVWYPAVFERTSTTTISVVMVMMMMIDGYICVCMLVEQIHFQNKKWTSRHDDDWSSIDDFFHYEKMKLPCSCLSQPFHFHSIWTSKNKSVGHSFIRSFIHFMMKSLIVDTWTDKEDDRRHTHIHRCQSDRELLCH